MGRIAPCDSPCSPRARVRVAARPSTRVQRDATPAIRAATIVSWDCPFLASTVEVWDCGAPLPGFVERYRVCARRAPRPATRVMARWVVTRAQRTKDAIRVMAPEHAIRATAVAIRGALSTPGAERTRTDVIRAEPPPRGMPAVATQPHATATAAATIRVVRNATVVTAVCWAVCASVAVSSRALEIAMAELVPAVVELTAMDHVVRQDAMDRVVRQAAMDHVALPAAMVPAARVASVVSEGIT